MPGSGMATFVANSTCPVLQWGVDSERLQRDICRKVYRRKL